MSGELKENELSRNCPYLHTINRLVLDFDFEKQCSVTLSHLNVYACLVCGKYFQGRGINSQASIHSLQADHHVFINLHTTKIYCLPDNYEIIDSSLDDIKYALDPTYTDSDIAILDQNKELVTTLDGSTYLPSIIGLNDIKFNATINAVLQAITRVPRLRNYFIHEEKYKKYNAPLLDSFGKLVRRVWSKGLFKGQISPHEVLQAISNESKKYYTTKNYEPIEFLSWFLNTMHTKLKGTRKPGSSIIHECFQGEVEITTYDRKKRTFSEIDGTETTDVNESGKIEDEERDSVEFEGYREGKTQTSPFLYLSLDIPPLPVFKSEGERDIIPQVPLYELLSKFDGKTVQHITQTSQKKRSVITKPPPYLILHIKRFTRNHYFIEKNHTIVNFPLKDLDIAEYCKLPENSKISTKYNLLANIIHEGEKDEELDKTLTRMEHDLGIKGTYKVNIQNKGDESWYEIQDLIVKSTMPQLIAVTEAYIQIYERID